MAFAVRCCFCGAPVKKKTSSETLCRMCEEEDDRILVEVLMFLRNARGRMREMYEVCAEVDDVTEKRVGRWKRLGWLKVRPDGKMQIDDGNSFELDTHLRRYIIDKMGVEADDFGEEDAETEDLPHRMVVVERLGLRDETPSRPKTPATQSSSARQHKSYPDGPERMVD